MSAPWPALLLVALAASPACALAQGLAAFRVSGDAIAAPLDGKVGDAARGRAIVANRQLGLCLLCHTAPIAEERFQGDLAPNLAGAGARWNAGQLRLRLVDPQRLVPGSLMPAYHRTDGLQQVGAAWRGKPLLDAQQIEDVVAWLLTLKE
ncbi:sulfur oxidation c-type cytochrome SoxX [Pseudorhodoferax sp.]|uniref:sulfur oxidation c-type cytochrome SoxX n=1 Tax=Pseudorhodoferax sp. TaxID=1993553 RepID=UPI002DD69A3C|nr:sulfur oxidation c-type cytochrome SoxX [Pseudorhodoferax sp.]